MEYRDKREKDWYWVDNAILACPHLTFAEKSVYSALATFSGCEKIHPNYITIGKRCGASARTAKNAVKKLIELECIEVKKGGGKGNANVYFLLNKPKGCKICTVTKGEKDDIQRVQGFPPKGAKSAHQVDNEEDKEINNLAEGAKSASAEWVWEQKLLELIGSKQRIHHIIGIYYKAKHFTFTSSKELSSAIKRDIRAAKEIEGYGDSKIIATLQWLRENADFKWTLETVHKYIDENLTEIKGQSDIIKVYKV